MRSVFPKITRIITTTSSASSAKRLRSRFLPTHSKRLIIDRRYGANLRAMSQADVILLACRPAMTRAVLGEPEVSDLLKGKVLISIMEGITGQTIMDTIYPEAVLRDPESSHLLAEEPTPDDLASAYGDISWVDDWETNLVVVRAMPNMGAQICESTTIIHKEGYPHAWTELVENVQLPITPEYVTIPARAFTTYLFGCTGRTQLVDPSLFDAIQAVTRASGAFLMPAIDGILDSCVAEGLNRSDAQRLLAHSIIGQAKLLLGPDEGGANDHPALMMERLAFPGGTTIQGL